MGELKTIQNLADFINGDGNLFKKDAKDIWKIFYEYGIVSDSPKSMRRKSICKTIKKEISLEKLLIEINKAKKRKEKFILIDPEKFCPKKTIGNELIKMGYEIFSEPTSPDSWRVKIILKNK